MKRIYLIITAVVVLSIVIFYFLFTSKGENSPNIILRDFVNTDELDNDNDGVPNWLEDLKGADKNNPKSFPYRKDVLSASTISVNDLIYSGPGDEVNKIVERFLDKEATINSLSDDELDGFVEDVSSYFKEKIDEREIKQVNISIDNNIDREEFARRYRLAVLRFSEFDQIAETTILKALAEEKTALNDLAFLNSACEYSIDTFPKKSSSFVYKKYYSVVERINNICEASKIATNRVDVEDYLFILKLLQAGEIVENGKTREDVVNKFFENVLFVIENYKK